MLTPKQKKVVETWRELFNAFNDAREEATQRGPKAAKEFDEQFRNVKAALYTIWDTATEPVKL